MHPSKHDVLIAIALALVIALAILKPALMHSFAQRAVACASKLMRAHILEQGLGDGAHSIFYDRDFARRKCSRIRLAKLVRI